MADLFALHVAGVDVSTLSDPELVDLAAAVAVEQQRRAVDAGDPEALCEEGFAEGFTSAGMPRDPYMRGGLIVCAGAKLDRSATSHDCGFVTVGDHWVWESEALVLDVVRPLAGPKPQMRSVSVVAGYEGLELDLVVSRMRTGVHQMRSVRSFVVRDGGLQLVSARAREAPSHAR